MNVVINTYCNLKCPYCFAEPTMAGCQTKNMSKKDFSLILNFLKKNNNSSLRLIGGEPTLHPDIETFINMAIGYGCFSEILIFSNFTFSEEFCNFIISKKDLIKFEFLPNINEFDLMPKKLKERICSNLDKLANEGLIDTIGINLYRPDMDLTQWENFLHKYKCIKHLRYSITVPTLEELKNNFVFYEYFHQFEPLLNKVIDMADKEGVFLGCDCNNIPPCCFSDETISRMYKSFPKSLGRQEFCGYPVIDCKPDLKIAGCFGFNNTKQDTKTIKDFKSYSEIYKWISEVDDKDKKVARKECLFCPRYKKTGVSCSCKSMHLLNVGDIKI